MSDLTTNTAARTPIATFLFFHTSHGLTEVRPIVCNFDNEGNIRHRGWIGEGIAVSKDLRPDPEAGLAMSGWGNDIYSVLNLCLFYIDKDGKMREQRYAQDADPKWYPGKMNIGQFDAAPGSDLAVRASDNGGLTWVWSQENSGEIRTYFRSDKDGQFTKTSVTYPPGLMRTSIATDYRGNSGVYYQLPDRRITQVELTPPEEPFSSETAYPPGTGIAATKDKMFCVTENNKIQVNTYDSGSNKWEEPAEIADATVIPRAPLTANAHQPPRDGTHSVTMMTQEKEHEITMIAFTDPNNVVITEF